MIKKAAIGLLVLLIALVGLRVGLGIYADSRLAVYDVTWKAEVAAERACAAALRRPVLHGAAPLDENAARRYMTLFAKETVSAAAVASAAKATELTPELAALLARERERLSALREATRCTRCDWEIPYESAFDANLPRLLEARLLARLLLAEGRFVDPREAANRSLDVIRVGSDFEQSGALVTRMVGVAVLHAGLEGLGQSIARAEPSALSLDAIAADLAAIESSRPTLADYARSERLQLRSMAGDAHSSMGTAESLLGAHVVLELGVLGLDAQLRDVEAAFALPSRAAREKAIEAVEARAQESWNPITQVGLANWEKTAENLDLIRGTFKLVETEIALEKERAADGTYPVSILLPNDPATEKPVVYERSADGKGWKLCSSKLTLERK